MLQLGQAWNVVDLYYLTAIFAWFNKFKAICFRLLHMKNLGYRRDPERTDSISRSRVDIHIGFPE